MNSDGNGISNKQIKTSDSVRALALGVSFIGAMVMAGWFLDVSWLKSIRPDWVTMKFTTAYCFLFSGITLYYTCQLRFGQRTAAFAVLPASLLFIALTMFTLFASTIFDIYLGIEGLFVAEKTGAVETTLPGRPSVGTMVAFLLVAVAGFVAMVRPGRLPVYLLLLGCIILLIGTLALVGYALDWPLLYYYTPDGISTAMAFHTAILFMLLGIGFIGLK